VRPFKIHLNQFGGHRIWYDSSNRGLNDPRNTNEVFMLKFLIATFTTFLIGTTAWAERASDRYQSINCATEGFSIENLIEYNIKLKEHQPAILRRLALKGYKGEILSKVLDISVQCTNSTKKSFELSDRVLISAFFQIQNDVCRFQFSASSVQDEKQILSFDYIHCVQNQ
jgi:hypothetical protein